MNHFEQNPQQPFERSPITPQPSLGSWFKRFEDRQGEYEQPNQSQNVVLKFLVPSIINLISDWHIGHPTTDYRRIEDEINEISSTPNSYVILAGDEIDNMGWNPGQYQEMEQTPEQVGFLRAIIKHLAGAQKLLHHIAGDHENWTTKAGIDLQAELPPQGVSVSAGPTYFHMDVENEHYEIGGAHQLPGHSIYNATHPQARSLRFGSMHGVDLVFSGHNHKKGIAKAYTHELGEPKEVTMVALGPYKSSDSWLSKKGWPAQKPEEMYGVSVYFDGKTHDIVTDMDIVRANQRMKGEHHDE